MDDSRVLTLDDNVRDGIAAVIKTTQQRESCAWTYLCDNPPDKSTGYMFSSDSICTVINGNMFSDNPMFSAILNNMQVGHSGSSYAWTMRNLQYIATHGIDAYIAAIHPAE
jgi:hypothetical protein